MRLPLTRNSDVVLALFVVAIATMLLIPLPTWTLDFLITLNLSVSLLLLMVGLYMQNALALLAFPSLLLLTTLFRLGLNVASTRLILIQGDAGRVIEAFGTFLIRGEIIVGIIIFLIITIVNFIVIARGSSRVSEVAARFALDALPGKQLAIDSDLKSGLITTQEAKEKRENLRKESQLYGSMDGAMKFVQGDAIAGFFIILTNILGGMYLGVSAGLSFSEAVETYTILTVGDGLVSQIPALLISICAGIIVTRVAASENSTLGRDLEDQIVSRHGALFFTGAILLVIGLLPGLPIFQFGAVGLLLILASLYLRRKQDLLNPDLPALPDSTTETYNPALLLEEDGADQPVVTIALDANVLYKMYRENSKQYLQWWRQLQTDFYNEVGVKLPDFRVVQKDLASAGSYEFLTAGTLVESETILLDSVLVETNPEQAGILGFDVLKEAKHPISGDRVFWGLNSPGLKNVSEVAQIRTFDFFQYISLKVAKFFQENPEEIFGLTDVFNLLKQLEKKYPGLSASALSSEALTIPRLTEILQELVREGVNIKDFRQIVECIAAFGNWDFESSSDRREFEMHEIVSFVRSSRKRQVLSRSLSVRQTLKVFTLNPDLEDMLESMLSEGASFAMHPEELDKLQNNLNNLSEPVRKNGLLPVSILCRADLRQQVSQLIRSFDSVLGVVTFDELDPSIAIEPVGVWEI